MALGRHQPSDCLSASSPTRCSDWSRVPCSACTTQAFPTSIRSRPCSSLQAWRWRCAGLTGRSYAIVPIVVLAAGLTGAFSLGAPSSQRLVFAAPVLAILRPALSADSAIEWARSGRPRFRSRFSVSGGGHPGGLPVPGLVLLRQGHAPPGLLGPPRTCRHRVGALPPALPGRNSALLRPPGGTRYLRLPQLGIPGPSHSNPQSRMVCLGDPALTGVQWPNTLGHVSGASGDPQRSRGGVPAGENAALG